MSEIINSIFKRYYSDEPFVDRYIKDKSDAIDVIIPIIHTNELWEANLRCFYREIPINRLLIGDGGCIDDSVGIAKKFPRVTVFDHKKYKSLGYSIRKLIEEVETDWFIYPHSDAYLPDGWFDIMKKYKGKYDWYGCLMQHTVMVEYNTPYDERPWAGAQVGRKKAFEQGLDKIEDDYVYRQEDFVWRKIIQEAGFKEGFIDETFHYHQTMYKPSSCFRKVKSVKIDVEMSPAEELRTWTTHLKGTVKYLDPSIHWAVVVVQDSLFRLLEMNQLNWKDFKEWVKKVNPVWLPYISRRYLLKRKVRAFLKSIYFVIFK